MTLDTLKIEHSLEQGLESSHNDGSYMNCHTHYSNLYYYPLLGKLLKHVELEQYVIGYSLG